MRFPTFRIAWRNLWRNKRRTLITGGGVGLGLAMMIFTVCWSEGLNRHMIEVVTRSMLGHAQLHATGYRQTREPQTTINDAGRLLALAEDVSGVERAAPRLYGEALLAIGDRSESVVSLGYDPRREAGVTNWSRKVTSGAMPSAPGELALGKALAQKLEVEVGSRVVVTSSDVFTGELNYRLAKGGVHEIALALTPDPTDQAALGAGVNRVLVKIGQRELEGAPWQELAPMIAGMVDLQGIYMAISLGLIFFLISFGIVNTMSMSLFERFREFGIMRAVGAPPGNLAALIVAEAGWLGLVGSMMGLALGLGLTGWLVRTGIVFGSQTEAMGVGLGTPIHPAFEPVGIALSTAAFMLLTPLVSALVAWRAARIDPVRALRHE
jgi:ABC-type lipoprotein release transport system permease subunit